MIRTRPFILLAALLPLLAAAPPASRTAALQESELPPALEALVGEWEGEGALMGSPARFSMNWSVQLGGRFVRLEFRNQFVDADSGAVTPVLEATAYYRPDASGETAEGWWFDSRGMVLPLRVSLTGSEVVAEWGDADSAERGRTTYRLLGQEGSRVEVVDEVLRNGELAVFATATYIRAEGRGTH